MPASGAYVPQVGDRVVIPHERGHVGEVLRVWPVEVSADGSVSCPPTASVRYLDGPYAGTTWGGYQRNLAPATSAPEVSP